MRGYEVKRPMVIAELIEDGVKSVSVKCVCGVKKSLLTENLPTGLTLRGLAQRLRCDVCDKKGEAHVEPDWHTRPQPGLTRERDSGIDQAD